ncbi:hypothetical protein HQ34_02395 [Porphyromonas cangingivalis]|nr:hypothetical protein HQ34_02395 [Porphyromonas cangingivalis]
MRGVGVRGIVSYGNLWVIGIVVVLKLSYLSGSKIQPMAYENPNMIIDTETKHKAKEVVASI